LRRAIGDPEATTEADWTSYVMFDGSVAAELIRLGRRDALDQANEIRSFFAAEPQSGQRQSA
jgi:hypothetical protein